MQVVPGETALAFYRAKNPTDKPIIGISTYNVVPFEAGQYFNKIQVCSVQTFLVQQKTDVSGILSFFLLILCFATVSSAVFLLRGAAPEPS